ncbi:MAG: hypothetical protein IPK03_08520 [Bacteroidetes bacterium]|nr:hypothetical protein [Bacteroidota bacterium]
MSIEDLKVIGKGEFAKDTLADIGKLNLALDLMSVIKSEKPMKIHSIEIFQPKIRAIVSRSGKANWDITKPSKESSKEEPFSLSLKKLLIEGEISNTAIIKADNLRLFAAWNTREMAILHKMSLIMKLLRISINCRLRRIN